MTRHCAAALILVGITAPLAAQQVVYEGSVTAATGNYFFTERTTSFGLGSGLSVRGASWTVRVAAPVWMQNTTLITSSGIGRVPTGGPAGQGEVRDSGQARERRKQDGSGGPGGPGGTGLPLRRTGEIDAMVGAEIPAPDEAITGYEVRLGDPVVTGTLRLLQTVRTTATVGAAVKAPLASTTVGTGKWDYGASVSLSTLVGRNLMVGSDIAYWHLGDLDSLELRDPLVGAISVGFLLGTRWAAMAGLSGSTSAIEGFDPAASVSLSLSRIGDRATWGCSVAAGLTESSPDFGINITWSVPLTRGPTP